MVLYLKETQFGIWFDWLTWNNLFTLHAEWEGGYSQKGNDQPFLMIYVYREHVDNQNQT